MSKRYCYVCRGGVAAGRRIAPDPILNTLLGIKKSLGISRSAGKELVVCRKCLPIYDKMRKTFIRKLAYLGVVALIIFIAQTYIVSIWAGFIFAAFILSFSLIYYAPALESEEPAPARHA